MPVSTLINLYFISEQRVYKPCKKSSFYCGCNYVIISFIENTIIHDPKGKTQAVELFDFSQLTLAGEVLHSHYESPPLAFVHSYGCQQNVSDGERIKGSLLKMGYGLTDDQQQADLILLNTCAVRETAEDRVWGHLGALKGLKSDNPGLIIALCGCMMQQDETAARVRRSFPYVDIVFGTGAIHKLHEFITRRLMEKKPVYYQSDTRPVMEGLPTHREGSVKAWLPIMQGCDNYCSYCIVPYVRGPETSRQPGAILAEAKEILAAGYREITLLGQNVNSYGKGLSEDIDFAGLIRRLDELPGDWWLRFMTSHPKDCTRELIGAIAESRHVARHIHLPVQSGSDSILTAMNRSYTAESYLSLIDYAREKMPQVTFSSDIIVGFPGETEQDFKATLNLVERVGYSALFTFIYSKRSGTPAADMPDPTPYSEKSARMQRLLKLQSDIGGKINQNEIGRTLRVLIEGPGRSEPGALMGRTEHNTIVELTGGGAEVGSFADVKIERAQNWALFGRLL